MTQDSPPCTWLVQATVRGETLARLELACRDNGRPLHRISVIPFSTELPPDMPDVDGPFIFYGYTTLLLNAFQSPRWRQGVFFDPDVFRPQVYLAHWGKERMLNHDARFLTLREFAEMPGITPSSSWFIKPDDDLKRFTGGVMTYTEFHAWYETIADLDDSSDISVETRVLVCPPKTFGHEWRLFFVGGRIITQSCYSAEGQNLLLPPELADFARDAVAAWSPADAFALDVTLGADGSPRIIEANCINGSGFYFADTHALVRALSTWQESNYAGADRFL